MAKASRTYCSNSSSVLGSGRHTSTECFSSGCDCRPVMPASSLKFDDRIPQGTELVIEAGSVLKSSYVTSVVISQVRGSYHWPCMTSKTRNPVKNAFGWGAALFVRAIQLNLFKCYIKKAQSYTTPIQVFQITVFVSINKPLSDHFLYQEPVSDNTVFCCVPLRFGCEQIWFYVCYKSKTQHMTTRGMWHAVTERRLLTQPTWFHRSAGADIR